MNIRYPIYEGVYRILTIYPLISSSFTFTIFFAIPQLQVKFYNQFICQFLQSAAFKLSCRRWKE